MESLFEHTHSFTDSQKPTITKTSTGEPPAVRVQMSHAPLHRPHDANLLGVVVAAPQPLDERPERAIVKRRQKVAVGRDVDHARLHGREKESFCKDCPRAALDPTSAPGASRLERRTRACGESSRCRAGSRYTGPFAR